MIISQLPKNLYTFKQETSAYCCAVAEKGLKKHTHYAKLKLPMENPLWQFSDNQGSFVSRTAERIKSLYFPLCNTYPLMSSLSADLHGDIKTNSNTFLLEPVSRIDLTNSKVSRNFWIYISPRKIWSATGVCKDISLLKHDRFELEAGLLWHKISRENKKIGLKSCITSFIPSTGEPIEIMRVDITNISPHPIKFSPTAAIPMFCRSINNIFDHRHVTSLLNRIQKDKFGVIITPTLAFDETGHKKNTVSYFVLGIDDKSCGPQHIWAAQEEFTGDDSDLEAPSSVFKNSLPDKKSAIQGKEAIGALRFKTKILQPKQSSSYIVLIGLTEDRGKINHILKKFNTPDKIEKSLQQTKEYWQKISREIRVNSPDNNFNMWLYWVNIQPYLRRIFGCSFLPDFDYGKGGRGWRDLWQDCLSLILTHPKEARPLLINNFAGCRIDGSNATIIGQKSGEFIADRNSILRVWMDHGIWPLFTTLLYIHETGDLNILFEKTTYFRDRQLSRSRQLDQNWSPSYGNKLKTKSGDIYYGTILEHILIQNLVQFFNVGPHNHIRLEGADWNDGLDMAVESGESVALTGMYARNLKDICGLLKKLNFKNIELAKELGILLDSTMEPPGLKSGVPRGGILERPLSIPALKGKVFGRESINYSDIKIKHQLLEKYFTAVKYEVSAETISISSEQLIAGLEKKADWIIRHIRKTEWLKQGFFNGYYNNDKQKVEGKINDVLRMSLTSQVFPILSETASREQVKTILRNVNKHLKDRSLRGLHLNTDFKTEQLNLGRAFSFVYGDKENGAFFNHMRIMFAYALYKQGFACQGYEVIDSIYRMSTNTKNSKIYPCLPEYFDASGRGMYSYLTGSASWFMLTLVTQVFGIKGEYGNFIIDPKLTAQQFKSGNTISLTTSFAQKTIEVKFVNPRKKDFGKYVIKKVTFNNKAVIRDIKSPRFYLSRKNFLTLANKSYNIIEVVLG